MLLKYRLFFCCFLILFLVSLQFHTRAQHVGAVVSGTVTDSTFSPISDVFIRVAGMGRGDNTDEEGFFRFTLDPGDYVLVLSHVEYQTIRKTVHLEAGDTLVEHLIMEPEVRLLQQVEVSGRENAQYRREAGLVRLNPQAARVIPSPFQEFTKILVTLPGVTGNNELSSAYSVRGGNYNENLVYVNDIPVYRPFLISSGQQEGLSFINPDLVSEVFFSSGGWQAKYGDKLSSTLNVKYKRPDQTRASLTASLLGGAAHLEGTTADQKITYVLGTRLKRARYLLNTLETNGQYLPKFTDLQAYLSFDLDGNPHSTITELGILTAFASNRYLVRPESRETGFGTLERAFRLYVGYGGQETLKYRTLQHGVKLYHRFSPQWGNKLIASWVNTQEREHFDLVGAYRLCDVEVNHRQQQASECNTILGIGANYAHARNKLSANILNLENRATFAFNAVNTLEFGVGYAMELIEDQLQQYDFSDSADYVTIHQHLQNSLDLHSNRWFAFLQNTFEPDEVHTLNYGVRVNYWSFNQQWLVSPRLQYAYKPAGMRDVVFRLAGGLYQQPPFYRELRDREGNLNPDIRAQSSAHAIAGIDYSFTMFGREFSLLSEVYYKYLYQVIPYEVDNVRIRYFADNNATAYAAGADFRISGDFIEGAESWFSLGILKTMENIEGDGRGYIRRPSDQLVNLGVFFQDHLPGDPASRVYLSMLFGSGLPFGPPDQPRYRNFLNGPAYKRVDIGFSRKLFFREEKSKDNSFLRSLWFSAEILNVLGTDNTISFNWVTDVHQNQYAVPNRLSARFLNLKVIARY